VNGKLVEFYVLDTSGSIGCDVSRVDPTCPCPLGKSESVLFHEAEQAQTRDCMLSDAMVPLVLPTFGELGTTGEGYLQN
jgi:hypothetical protein